MYKYLNITGGIRTLEARSVKFTRAVDFNDPFDLNLEEALGADFDEFAVGLLDAMCNFLFGDVEYEALRNDENRDNLIRAHQALRYASPEQREVFRRDLLATPVGELYDRARMEQLNAETLRGVQDGLRMYGVFCASETHDSALMWAHYADKHTGIVLQFTPQENSMFLAAKPVAYSRLRPLLYRTAEEMVRSYAMPLADSVMRNIDKIIFTKSIEWAYERELRLAVPDIIPEGQDFGTLRFAHQELTSVFLGCRTPDNHKEDVVALARFVNPGVGIYQARTAKREYSLEFTRVL
jgi:hypothetical protein